MSTLVCFHAHPDDEAIATGGSMARAAAEGHRVVLVVATNGEHGEVPDDLAPGESLADRRRRETDASAEALGISRVVWLGYSDSGMTGWEQNGHPDSFVRAELDVAARRLAAVLEEEAADVLTAYDWHGNYGHPDHIKVHQVGHAAADLVPSVRLFEATMNRDVVVEMIKAAIESGAGVGGPGEGDFDPEGPADDGNPFGMPQSELTMSVDVSDYVQHKRAAIACHRSQITDQSFFLEMPDEAFAQMFGTEWFIERGAQPPMQPGWLFR
jgi:LmbE family N-acetylglucosaminyl deacetylase